MLQLSLHTTSSSSRQGATLFIDFRAVLLLACCVFHYNSQNPHPFSRFPSCCAGMFFHSYPHRAPLAFVNENSCWENSIEELHLAHKEGQRNKSRQKRTRHETRIDDNPEKPCKESQFFFANVLQDPFYASNASSLSWAAQNVKRT